MNHETYSTAVRSLYGEPAGTLRAAWRRATAQHRSRRRSLAMPARAVAQCLAACAIGFGVSSIVGGVTAVATPVAAAPNGPEALAGAAAPFMPTHADAVQDLLAQRHASAYGRFAQLADAGHVPSALMALVMVCHGTSVFGSDWSATPGQLQRWSAMTGHDAGLCAQSIPDHDRGE